MRGNYEVELDMTVEEFDALSERQQNDEINDAMDWRDWMDNSDLDDLDIDEVAAKLKEEEKEGK